MRPSRQRLRAVLRRLPRPFAYGLLALLTMGVVGRIVRDRSAAAALLLYLPLIPIGLVAAAYDFARRGRALPRGRFVLAAVGLLGAAVDVGHMVGWRRPPAADLSARGGGPVSPTARGREVTLVHWNVQWGGSRRGTDRPWQSVTAALAARRPDVVVLSEAPPEQWVREWVAGMEGWSVAFHDGSTGAKYRSQLAVVARWPTRNERDVRLPNGSGVIVRVDVPPEPGGAVAPRGRPLRVFVVDGRSGLGIHRTPLLREVARVCDAAAAAGEPVDVIAGDFNAVSRSTGFDALRHARVADGDGGGYALASEFSGGWRGTFPAPLPLYDIDHVWVRREVDVDGCDLFSCLTATDHRGQAVRLRW